MCRWSCLPRKRRRLSSTLWNIKRGEYQHAFFVGINVWAHPPNISTSKTVSIKLPEASLVACFKALCLKWLLLHTFALTVHDYTCYCGVQVSFFQTGKQTYTKMSLTIILDFFRKLAELIYFRYVDDIILRAMCQRQAAVKAGKYTHKGKNINNTLECQHEHPVAIFLATLYQRVVYFVTQDFKTYTRWFRLMQVIV